MVPSSESIAGPNVVLNTAVAEILADFASELEKASDKNATMQKLVKEAYLAHKRVIFNGNGYSDEWVAEAEKRGLPNIKTTVEAIAEIITPESVALFEKHKVFTKEELESRFEVYLEKYCMQMNIEAHVMVEMADLQIFPAAAAYAKELAEGAAAVKAAGGDVSAQTELIKAISVELKGLKAKSDELKKAILAAAGADDAFAMGKAFKFKVYATMEELRAHGDALEISMVAKTYWPFPTYEDLLFRCKLLLEYYSGPVERGAFFYAFLPVLLSALSTNIPISRLAPMASGSFMLSIDLSRSFSSRTSSRRRRRTNCS